VTLRQNTFYRYIFLLYLHIRHVTARQDSDSQFQFIHVLGLNLLFSYTEYGPMHSEQLKIDSVYKMVVTNQFSVCYSSSSFRNSIIMHVDLFGCDSFTLLTEVHKLKFQERRTEEIVWAQQRRRNGRMEKTA
jgi:hypothetical protein